MTLIQLSERIREEAEKQRKQGDLAAAKALERLDVGNVRTPRTSVEVSRSSAQPSSRRPPSATARLVANANTVSTRGLFVCVFFFLRFHKTAAQLMCLWTLAAGIFTGRPRQAAIPSSTSARSEN